MLPYYSTAGSYRREQERAAPTAGGKNYVSQHCRPPETSRARFHVYGSGLIVADAPDLVTVYLHVTGVREF